MESFIFYLYSQHHNERMEFSSENDVFMYELSMLINKLPKVEGGNLLALLCNTQELRDSLQNFVDVYEAEIPRVRRIVKYVERLAENEFFFYLDERASLFSHLCCVGELHALPDMNERGKVHNSILQQYGKLFTSFESYGYGYDGIVTTIGNHHKYPCRFCGKDKSKTSFKKLAHAIPDALGNDLLFCDEECGDCNGRLHSIEDNLTDFLDFNRVTMGIKSKKRKLPEVEGENFVIRRSSEGVKIFSKEPLNADEFKRNGLRLNHRKVMTNLGLYKALVKIAMDLMPSDRMAHFKETIRWINGHVISKRMPSIYWRYSQPAMQPSFYMFFNRKDDSGIPYCTCVLFVCNVAFMYIVPFVDIDEGKFKRDEMLKGHWPLFLETFQGEWNIWNLADDIPATPYFDVVSGPDDGREKMEPMVAPPSEVFEIHHRPTKSVFVDFPEINIENLFKKLPEFVKERFIVENKVEGTLEPYTELSFGMGCTVFIYYDEGRCETYNTVSINDTTDRIKYLDIKWKCLFEFTDITANIEWDEKHFCFDYKLRDILWQLSLFMGEKGFQKEMNETEFKETKMTSIYDEHHLQFIHYVVMKDGKPVFDCEDKVMHR